jgi:hypothetical protein
MPTAGRPTVDPTNTKELSMARVKKILLWVLVAFIAYAIFTSPDQAADILKTSGGIVVDGAKNVGNFFDALLGRK